MEQNNFIIVLTTVETEQQTEELSQKILEKKLGACVQTQKIKSRYWWKGEIKCGDEYLLSIKTKTKLFSDLSKFIEKNHPYETPEIVQIPIINGSDEYLEWLESVLICEKS
ncbi:MAG: divalent-cation tolerance protein CutA [Holosporaceae bacterium]|jgi:periplasmic divalent cation tolerance protein|nr:divalent-cation tolerance protein CutA [Holosporaceae bacterium]